MTRWWQYGLFGGVVLSLATIVNVVRHVVIGGAGGQVGWTEVINFALAIFGMGFLCGVVVWGGRWISRRFGVFGDAIVGMVVMLVFFTACMLLFEPDLLGPRGWPMLAFGAVLGLVGGVWVGRDLRKQWAKDESEPWRQSEEEDA